MSWNDRSKTASRLVRKYFERFCWFGLSGFSYGLGVYALATGAPIEVVAGLGAAGIYTSVLGYERHRILKEMGYYDYVDQKGKYSDPKRKLDLECVPVEMGS